MITNSDALGTCAAGMKSKRSHITRQEHLFCRMSGELIGLTEVCSEFQLTQMARDGVTGRLKYGMQHQRSESLVNSIES